MFAFLVNWIQLKPDPIDINSKRATASISIERETESIKLDRTTTALPIPKK